MLVGIFGRGILRAEEGRPVIDKSYVSGPKGRILPIKTRGWSIDIGWFDALVQMGTASETRLYPVYGQINRWNYLYVDFSSAFFALEPLTFGSGSGRLGC